MHILNNSIHNLVNPAPIDNGGAVEEVRTRHSQVTLQLDYACYSYTIADTVNSDQSTVHL